MFYTQCTTRGNNILLSYIHDGVQKYAKINNYEPSLFGTAHDGDYTQLITGETLKEIKYGSIKEAKKAIEDARDIHGYNLYGNRNFHLTFLNENFNDMESSYRPDLIRGFNVDIECPSEQGFPEPHLAQWPINAMTIKDSISGKYIVWALYKYEPEVEVLAENGISMDELVIYDEFESEVQMLNHMLTFWETHFPTYVTGWNTSGFDLPYLCTRLQNLGLDMGRLSPWGSAYVREKEYNGKIEATAYIAGVEDLDYQVLYKKHRLQPRETYRLDFIAEVEECGSKLDYSDDAASLRDLWKKNWNRHVTYNIVDVKVVDNIDRALQYITVTMAIAYAAGINLSDTLSPVATWEQLIYRDQIGKKIILPNKQNNEKVSFEGAFVKVPQVGKHRWVCSFDLNSLYPHLIMQFNISPDCITPTVADVNVDHMVEGLPYNSPDPSLAVCPSGNTFTKTKKGVFSELMERMYLERKSIKREGLDLEQMAIDETDPIKSADYNYQAKIKDVGQHARKILLNSGYGAFGNVHFNMYDLRLARSITTSGQLAIRWVGRVVNEKLNAALGTDTDYVIYTDTDSIYVKLEEIVKRKGMLESPTADVVKMLDEFCDNTMMPIIDQGYEDMREYCNAPQQKMIMAREVISDNSVFCAKKMYAMSVWNSEGVAYDEPYIKVLGLNSIVKSSTPAVVRKASKELVSLMLNGTEEDVQTSVAKFREQFKQLSPEEIAFPRGINGVQEKYCRLPEPSQIVAKKYRQYTNGATVPIHSRAAICHNLLVMELGIDEQLIQPADKMKFIHVKKPNKVNEDVIGFITHLPKEFNMHDKVDYDLMYDKSFLNPAQDILDLIGWDAKPQPKSLFG